MIETYTCSRCNNLFEVDSGNSEYEPESKYNVIYIGYKHVFHIHGRLCPKCLKELVEFLGYEKLLDTCDEIIEGKG